MIIYTFTFIYLSNQWFFFSLLHLVSWILTCSTTSVSESILDSKSFLDPISEFSLSDSFVNVCNFFCKDKYCLNIVSFFQILIIFDKTVHLPMTYYYSLYHCVTLYLMSTPLVRVDISFNANKSVFLWSIFSKYCLFSISSWSKSTLCKTSPISSFWKIYIPKIKSNYTDIVEFRLVALIDTLHLNAISWIVIQKIYISNIPVSNCTQKEFTTTCMLLNNVILPIWLKSDLFLRYRIEDLITPDYWSCSVLIILTNQLVTFMRLKAG